MNYFGLFFTFMVPGILMGIMMASVLRESLVKKQRAMKRRERACVLAMQNRPVQGKLYVHNLREDLKSAA